MGVLLRCAAILGLATPIGTASPPQDFAAARAAMVANIRTEVRAAAPRADNKALARALAAIGQVPREAFVPRRLSADAYRETPLPIGHAQTISDAYIVALMTAAANPRPGDHVLDVGTGSGYQAAVLARLAARVASIEIVPELAEQARTRLATLDIGNVEVRAGDGYAGWPERAPFDAIIVAAGAAHAPQPLLDQLNLGGRLVMPIGPSWATEQILVITRVTKTKYARCSLGWSMFVPLTGQGKRERDTPGVLEAIPLCHGAGVARPSFRLAG